MDSPSSMPARRRRRAPRFARVRPGVVLALGLASGLLLVLVSLLDFGDPRVEARVDARRDAEAHAEAIRLAWEALRRSPELPEAVAARTLELDPGAELSLGPAMPPGEDDSNRLAEILTRAAIAAASEGDLEGALTTLDDAIARAVGANPQQAALSLFHATRFGGQLGDAERVRRYREQLLAGGADAIVEGTSARLLATLVPPLDPASAFALLEQRSAMLPPPADGVSASLELVPDPWWAALREPLEFAGPAFDWDLAFQTRARLARALEGRLVPPPGDAGSWTFERIEGALIAHRLRADAWTVAPVSVLELVEALTRAAALPSNPTYPHFSGKGTFTACFAAGEQLLAESSLDGIDLAFTIRHPDPVAAAAPVLRRIRFLRIALLGLAGLVVLAAALAARAMSRAARLSELRSTFVASVSHDLRTPTQAILLMAETLEQGRIATPESRERYHVQIRREAQRLRRLVEDLLDSARIDRGDGARVERRPVDAASLLDELESAMRERAENAGAALSVTRGPLPATIEVDPDSVHRAVWNLFENALLHGRDGDGDVSVRIAFTVKDGVLECIVQDEGPGVPARHREAIFDAFERLRDRGAQGGIEDDTGTGLGLAIVRALSRAHGGDATLAESERGARFVASFPIESDGASGSAGEGAA